MVASALQHLLLQIESEIKEIETSEPLIIPRCQRIIQKLNSCEFYKKKFRQADFHDKAEEIFFFKNVKSAFYSKLFFYTDILNIESGRPNGKDKKKRKYLESQLDKLSEHFESNKAFYQYCRLGFTDMDDKYFIRISELGNRYDQTGGLIHCYDKLSSSHDLLYARVVANDLLQQYLTRELRQLTGVNISALEGEGKDKPGVRLTWTESKAGLIELLYALHSADCINKGKVGLRDLATFAERVFAINLGDFYRTYHEMKLRSSRTKFIDLLKDRLSDKMDQEEDENDYVTRKVS
jgi:hypothetical protein